MTTFRRIGPLPALPKGWPVMSLEEQIAAEGKRRMQAEVRRRFRSEKIITRGGNNLRPGADLADDIVAAYNKARREQGDADDPHDDDKPHDDNPELRGPDQTRIVATADAIIAAMKKAAGEL
jgi:hypothetical protein